MERLDSILGGKNYGVFRNNKGEYCQIGSYYMGNVRKFNIIFSDGLGSLATRNAIRTVSEKKVLKLIKNEGFVLQE